MRFLQKYSTIPLLPFSLLVIILALQALSFSSPPLPPSPTSYIGADENMREPKPKRCIVSSFPWIWLRTSSLVPILTMLSLTIRGSSPSV